MGFANLVPVEVVGAGMAIWFPYHSMRRMGKSLKSGPDMSTPSMVLKNTFESFRSGLLLTVERVLQSFPWLSI